MDVKITTQTPIWTGGVYGRVERLYETGILGSLRWWYELFIRGLGGWVVDPTSNDRCILDFEKYKKLRGSDERTRLRQAGLCDASQVFGATGWKRLFRLTIEDYTERNTSSPKKIIIADRNNPENNRKSIWQFSDHPRSGNFTFRLQSLANWFPSEVIGGLIQFMSDWTAIGAKGQMGFGVIEPTNGPMDTRPLYNWLVHIADNHPYPTTPSMQNIFLARIQLKDVTEEETFNLKYDLRRLFKHDKELRHFVMGTIKGNRMASKIKMSRPYGKGLMRVWGWIPTEAKEYKNGWNREAVVQSIFDHLRTNYTLDVWREMCSSRDTVIAENSDPKAFLKSLLGLKEK